MSYARSVLAKILCKVSVRTVWSVCESGIYDFLTKISNFQKNCYISPVNH
jgi:hypothetical protein